MFTLLIVFGFSTVNAYDIITYTDANINIYQQEYSYHEEDDKYKKLWNLDYHPDPRIMNIKKDNVMKLVFYTRDHTSTYYDYFGYLQIKLRYEYYYFKDGVRFKDKKYLNDISKCTENSFVTAWEKLWFNE